MTRIIAGAIGSLQLKPAAKATRPTSDRVKESLFAKLDAMGVIEGAKVLDLFAGTGALGLESASRGASKVDFVELDKNAHGVLRENVAWAEKAMSKIPITIDLQVHRRDSERFLTSTSETYDLVFFDPPYNFSDDVLERLMHLASQILRVDGLLVLERSSRGRVLILSAFEEKSSKSYGDTRLQIFKAVKQKPVEP